MANIVATIKKEVEKGNLYLDKKANFVSASKIETTLKKSYIDGLKNGSINIEKPFTDYRTEEIESTYIPVSAVEEILKGLFDTEESVDIPEPIEEATEN